MGCAGWCAWTRTPGRSSGCTWRRRRAGAVWRARSWRPGGGGAGGGVRRVRLDTSAGSPRRARCTRPWAIAHRGYNDNEYAATGSRRPDETRLSRPPARRLRPGAAASPRAGRRRGLVARGAAGVPARTPRGMVASRATRSPFYRERLAGLPLDGAQLERLPTMDKAALMDALGRSGDRSAPAAGRGGGPPRPPGARRVPRTAASARWPAAGRAGVAASSSSIAPSGPRAWPPSCA